MSEEIPNWIAKIATVSGDNEFQKYVAQISSKSLLKEITNIIPAYNWTYVESQLVKNMSTISFLIEEIALTKPQILDTIKNATLRLAIAWEHISRLKEKTNTKNALMNAAVSYEIAGYQANASCLAKQILEQNKEQDKFSLNILCSYFLQRLFLNLKIISNDNLQEPDLIKNEAEFTEKLGTAIASKAFLKACEYFLSGNIELLEDATMEFKNAEEFFTSFRLIEESNLMRSLQSLLPIMKQHSTWQNLSNVIENNTLWNRYLTLLARGVGNDLLNSTSISEVWPSQIEAIKNNLFDSKNKIIRMPTSAGKTRIAEMAIAHSLISNPGSKCVYVAPYRALVSELEHTLLDIFGDLGFKVSTIIGSYEIDPFELSLTNDVDILVLTPEKLDLLFRTHSEFLKSVGVFIFDEGHIINDDHRGIKFELLLTRIKRKFKNSRFLMLSAVLSDETIKEFLTWFNSDVENDKILTNWRPTIQQHAKFEWAVNEPIGVLRYLPRPENEILKTFVPGVITNRKYKFRNLDTGRNNTQVFPSKEKNETAAELAFKFSTLGPVLIYTTRPLWVTSIARSLYRRLDLTDKIHETLPTHFVNVDSKSVRIATDWFGEDNEITKFLKRGIAIHHGDLPEVLKRAIESDFRERIFQVIISTNTLAQGVNFPIRTVIIHSCRRWNDSAGISEPISANEYWNVAGRAGRAMRETEGTVIHIINGYADMVDYDAYLEKRNNLDPTHGALFESLLKLVNDRLSYEVLRERLDPEILAMLAEESSFENLDGIIDELLSGSLIKSQTLRYPAVYDKARVEFKKIANEIIQEIKDPDLFTTYSSTGLSTKSCITIRQFIENDPGKIKDLITTEKYENLEVLLSSLLDVFSQIHEMIGRRSYGGDRFELLKLWLNGKNISEITLQTHEDEIDTMNFIEDYFGYLLPWGISSFIQIAEKTLEISNEKMANQIRYLSSMVKFGVPIPEACWAMQIGIPFKNLAMQFAQKYLSETRISSYEDFTSWLSRINSEQIKEDYQISGPFLDDVTKSIMRVGSNPFLAESMDLKQVLKTPTDVRGIYYDNRRIVASMVYEGDTIEIMRDYNNLHDRNAIKILFKGQELGYLSRDLAQYLAPYIDTGLILSGVVTKVEKKDIPVIMINLSPKSI